MLKDLKRRFHNIPPLVSDFQDAVEELYDVRIYKVSEKHYDRFSKFEQKLRKHDYDFRDYAFTTCKFLRSWCRKKNFKVPPINVFLGDWAFGKYEKVEKTSFVTIDRETADQQSIIHSEYLVAKYYIDNHCEGNPIKFSDAVKDLRPLVCDEWVELYESGGKRPFLDVLELLELEYAVSASTNYNDIITKKIL